MMLAPGSIGQKEVELDSAVQLLRLVFFSGFSRSAAVCL